MLYYFDIAVTAQSVILGFACARVLHATPHIFSKLCYLKIYLLWYVLCLHILNTFWTTMFITKLPDFDFLDFVLLIIYSGVTFIMCNSVFPSNSDKISSWENHYFTINKIFWVCNIIWVKIWFLQSWSFLQFWFTPNFDIFWWFCLVCIG